MFQIHVNLKAFNTICSRDLVLKFVDILKNVISIQFWLDFTQANVEKTIWLTLWNQTTMRV